MLDLKCCLLLPPALQKNIFGVYTLNLYFCVMDERLRKNEATVIEKENYFKKKYIKTYAEISSLSAICYFWVIERSRNAPKIANCVSPYI